MAVTAVDAALIDAFCLAQRRRNFSEKTIACRTAVLSRLSAQGPGLLKATRRDIESFLDSRRLGPQGRYTYLAHLHAFYGWAVRTEVAKVDPTVTIDRPRLPKRLPKPIPQTELARALAKADPRMKAWLLLGALAGFRRSDMAALRREDVGDLDSPPTIRVTQGKGKKDRCLPMHPDVLAALRAYGLPESGPVFTTPAGEPVTPAAIGYAIAAFLRRCGVERSAHSLRHAFGSAVYRASRDLLLTKELLGHSSLSTAMGYVEINPDDSAAAVVCGL